MCLYMMILRGSPVLKLLNGTGWNVLAAWLAVVDCVELLKGKKYKIEQQNIPGYVINYFGKHFQTV